STNTQNRMDRVTRTITYAFQKPLMKSAICFSLFVLPAADGRHVVIAQGQARRLVEARLGLPAVSPGADAQKAQQAHHREQTPEVVDIHGALPQRTFWSAVPSP